jgi:hypothetical protein
VAEWQTLRTQNPGNALRIANRMKVLVINFDSPSGSISDDYVRDAKSVMRAAFKDDVRPYFLFYRDPV